MTLLVAARPDAPSARVRWSAGLLVALAVVLLVPGRSGLLLAVPAVPVTAVLLGRLQLGALRRERSRVVLELPETLDLLAAALDAGLPLRVAVRHVAEIGPPSTRDVLAGVAARVGVGMSDAEAWRALADDPEWVTIAGDLARSSETGTASAQMLRQHADDARGARRDELLKRARAVGVRSTLPLMACFLPAFLLVGVVPVVAGLVGTFLHR